MPPPPQRHYSWTHTVPPCPNTSVGVSDNETFTKYGQSTHTKPNEDRWYNGKRNNLQLCMVLDGHDGERAVDFARMFLAGILLEREMIEEDLTIRDTIRKAFLRTETEYFLSMDDAITRRVALVGELNQRAQNSYDAQMNFPLQVAEITRLEAQITGGTTVVMALICNNMLYVANVGDSRAVLCHWSQGKLQCDQISDDHNVYNPSEQRRLKDIGLNVQKLVDWGRLGPYAITRSIGDYSIKGGYKDVDILSHAREEPASSDPYVNGPWKVDYMNGFLMLMSDGLYDAYGKYIGTNNPQAVHDGLAELVVEEMRRLRYRNIEGVAQAVVNTVRENHKRKLQNGRVDDITLLIYSLGYPLGPDSVNLDHTDSPGYASTVPYEPQLNQHRQAALGIDRKPEGYFSPTSGNSPSYPLQATPFVTAVTPDPFIPPPAAVSADHYPAGYPNYPEIPYNASHSHPSHRPPVPHVHHGQLEGFFEGVAPRKIDFNLPENPSTVRNVPASDQNVPGNATTAREKDPEKMAVVDKTRPYVPEPSPYKQDKPAQKEPEPPAKEEHMIPCHVVFPSHLLDKTLDDF